MRMHEHMYGILFENSYEDAWMHDENACGKCIFFIFFFIKWWYENAYNFSFHFF